MSGRGTHESLLGGWWMEAILGAYPPCLLLKMRCA